MRFVTISDTHGKHKELTLPEGDILIHAGDITRKGEEREVDDFLEWFKQQDYKNKILIAGNSDFYFERASEEEILKKIPKGVIYLNDSGAIIEDFKIWGSPVTPWFLNLAFNRHRGTPIKHHWDLIPGLVDVLITHGPAFNRLDTNYNGEHLGCKDLFNRIQEVNPQVHVCGHIHESYGVIKNNGILFVNASVVNQNIEIANPAITFELSNPLKSSSKNRG